MIANVVGAELTVTNQELGLLALGWVFETEEDIWQ